MNAHREVISRVADPAMVHCAFATAPLGSVTLPLTCVIATAWALAELGDASQQRIEIDSSNRRLKVYRDSCHEHSPENKLSCWRKLGRLTIALPHFGILHAGAANVSIRVVCVSEAKNLQDFTNDVV